jgi:hypothetical protein
MKLKWLVLVGIVIVALVAYQYSMNAHTPTVSYQLPSGTSDVWATFTAEVVGQKSGLGPTEPSVESVKMGSIAISTSGPPSSAPTSWDKAGLVAKFIVTQNGTQVATSTSALPFDTTIKGGSDTSDYYGFDHTNTYCYKAVGSLSKGWYTIELQIIGAVDGKLYCSQSVELT